MANFPWESFYYGKISNDQAKSVFHEEMKKIEKDIPENFVYYFYAQKSNGNLSVFYQKMVEFSQKNIVYETEITCNCKKVDYFCDSCAEIREKFKGTEWIPIKRKAPLSLETLVELNLKNGTLFE